MEAMAVRTTVLCTPRTSAAVPSITALYRCCSEFLPEEQKRKGLKPHDHTRDNKQYIKQLEQLNRAREEVAAAEVVIDHILLEEDSMPMAIQ